MSLKTRAIWLMTRFPAGARIATVASAAMIAEQVAGKATRDALFLSTFRVTALPAMMAASAVLSLFAALWLSRMMMRHSPAKVVPIGFAVGGAALLAEWTLSFFAPRLAAVAVYLQMALFGAAMISAFWSLINETYDPHTGRGAVAAITGGGTLGGLLGGLVAWRASTMFSVPTMLPLLAAVSLVASWGSFRLRDPKATPLAPKDVADVPAASMLSPLRFLRDSPYLRHLAAIVALGAVTSGLLDYVFSAEAAKAFEKGPALLSFFALFWLVVGALSFLVQTLLGRIALERLGLAVTIALLPGVVILGGAVGLAVPGLWSTAILRGGEATHRNSLFRAAYELLYTPLSEQRKRTTKTLIDVGFDRVGTLSAAGVAVVTLWLAAGRAETILLAVAIACALVALARSRPLHMGYVAVLEESLRKGAEQTQPPATASIPATVEKVEVRDKIVEHLDALPHSTDLAAICTGDAPVGPKLQENGARTVGKTPVSVDVSLEAIADLGSGNAQRVRRVLGADGPLDRSLISFAILLLADNEFHSDAIRALRKVVAKTAGQLIDALCDPSVDFQIRRRIPRVLSHCRTQSVADGLIRGTDDVRFEVRYECGRALLKITDATGPVVIALETVIAIVQREVSRSKDVWESQPASDLDEEDNEGSELCDRLLRDRIDRSLEHVFTILALHLDRDSLRIAFRALHEKDERIRGTALEYLETVLPDEIRDAVWPFLGEARPMRPARPAPEILADLRQETKAALPPRL
jgi:AAA family ATP:ADP antiporter